MAHPGKHSKSNKNKLSAVKTNTKLKSKVTNYSKNSSGGMLVKNVKKVIKLYDKYSGASLMRKGLKRVGKYMMKNAAATGPPKVEKNMLKKTYSKIYQEK